MVNRPKRPSRKVSGANHRSTLSLQKTEVLINVYDLLPAGRLSSVLWTFGSSLLHTGVVINGKEYAYGGHDHPGKTGVYWTRPKLEPPGGIFKCEVLHGFTIQSEEDVENAIKEVSSEYLGQSYNLLKRNCNHFTNALCQRLTSRPAPKWLNRAASIGVALPCIVPPEWLAPPDYETADGALLEEDEDEADERSHMLQEERIRHSWGDSIAGGSESDSRRSRSFDERSNDNDRHSQSRRKDRGTTRDSSGRRIPASERAPTPPGS